MIEIKTSSLERRLKGAIPPFLKKALLSVFVNTFFGSLIRLLKIRGNLHGGVFDYSIVSNMEAAQIFWGVWESAEIRFSKRFANSTTVIELGSSIGVTLGVLANTRKNTNFICVEASIVNFEKLSRLRHQLPENENSYFIVNKAIAYGTDWVEFDHLTTTGSKIGEVNNEGRNMIPAITLNKLLLEHEIDDAFTLISDIEGAEAEIFFQDVNALRQCERIIAELEDMPEYSLESQIEQLTTLGFNLRERYGNVVVMER